MSLSPELRRMAEEAHLIRSVATGEAKSYFPEKIIKATNTEFWHGDAEQLEAFACAVAEDCAKVCDNMSDPYTGIVADHIRAKYDLKA